MRRRVPLSVALVLASACRFDFDYRVAPVDAGVQDVAQDGAQDGLLTIAQACPEADADTLVLYNFDTDDGTVISDATGVHHGLLRNSATPPLVAGPTGCGSALEFAAGSEVYVEIPHSEDWQLASGSIDLWVRPVPDGMPEPDIGIVGRDASFAREPGHFYLHQWTSVTPNIFVSRIQRMDDGGAGVFLCSDGPVVPGRWTHIGINFGPPGNEMWIDGVRAENSDLLDTMTGAYPCNTGEALGIAGNSNPWGLGVDTGYSTDGAVEPIRHPFAGGAIDHLRISGAHRDFSVFSRL